jgi:hypothetical protein
MALRLEVSRVDKSYPEALTEGTRHRGGKGVDPDHRIGHELLMETWVPRGHVWWKP